MRTRSAVAFKLLGNDVGWQMDALGWFFAVITVGAAGFAAAYAAGEWGEVNAKQGLSLRWLYAGLQINVLAMMLLLSAADFISLFIGWELTSWAGLILMLLRGGEAIRAALRYIVYALAGRHGGIRRHGHHPCRRRFIAVRRAADGRAATVWGRPCGRSHCCSCPASQSRWASFRFICGSHQPMPSAPVRHRPSSAPSRHAWACSVSHWSPSS